MDEEMGLTGGEIQKQDRKRRAKWKSQHEAKQNLDWGPLPSGVPHGDTPPVRKIPPCLYAQVTQHLSPVCAAQPLQLLPCVLRFGCRSLHTDTKTCRCSPFLHDMGFSHVPMASPLCPHVLGMTFRLFIPLIPCEKLLYCLLYIVTVI